jgi:ribosome-associated protein
MDKVQILSELNFKAVRSSGAGGQNVNKVSSKVVLNFDVENSNGLSEEEKPLVLSKLASRLTKENILILNCDEDRSQFKNKAIVTNVS